MKRTIESTFRILITALVLIPGASCVAAPTETTIDAMPTLTWQQKAPGIWSAQIGTPEKLTYMSFAGAPVKIDALTNMEKAEFPLDKEQIRGFVSGNRSIVRVPLGTQEKLYGLGLQFEGMNRRGRVYHMRMDHYSRGQERLHAPVPFYVSSEGYGVFFNSPRFISIYAGIGNRKDSPNLPPIRDRNTDRAWQAQPTSDAVEASVIADGLEVVVIAGPTMLNVIQRYNLYCGGGCLPPKWGLGFWHRMPTHASDKTVQKEVAEFEKRDFPLDVIGLEPGWHSKAYPCSFEWNPQLFPQPKKFMDSMTDSGIHINLWENPFVSPYAGIYDAIKPYTGSHMVWLGTVPDYTMPQARKIMTDQHDEEHVAIGVSGYKVDEVDGYDFWLWPDHAVFPSGNSAEFMRQTYGLQMQQSLMEIFRKRNLRTYSQVRASNAGASSYPFAIYTDHYKHRGFVSALVNSGFAGVLYTPEIRSAGSSEEWVRRMQSVCFSPLIQLNGWASKTKPWSFPDVEGEVRDVIKLRMQMLPYLYTAFAKYHYEGTPPIRAMVLESGYDDKETVVEGKLHDTNNPYAMAIRKDVADQYIFGDCMLVAPIFTGQKSRQVILPRGKWYDFYTGKFIGGGEVITAAPPLDKIPLYVKDGGIIPMIAPINRISKLKDSVALEIRHYGTSPSTAMLYDDDGNTFDYEKGNYCWLEMKVTKQDSGKLVGSVKKAKGDYDHWYDNITWKFMTE